MKNISTFAKAGVLTLLLFAVMPSSSGAAAQEPGQAKWASADDPVARQLIEQERIWATLDCNSIRMTPAAVTAAIDQFIAADFVGTSPNGALYGKADLLPKPPPAKAPEPERDCKLLSARVRFVTPDVAIVYGSERALLKSADGKYTPRTLAWTDTWLLRARKWQIVAVQDMVVAAK